MRIKVYERNGGAFSAFLALVASQWIFASSEITKGLVILGVGDIATADQVGELVVATSRAIFGLAVTSNIYLRDIAGLRRAREPAHVATWPVARRRALFARLGRPRMDGRAQGQGQDL